MARPLWCTRCNASIESVAGQTVVERAKATAPLAIQADLRRGTGPRRAFPD